VVRDPKTDEVIELRCTYDPATRGGSSPDGRKVKATLHWVSVAHAVEAEVRLYDRLFLDEHPGENRDFLESLNPDSLKVIRSVQVEPSLKNAQSGSRYQFERLGYFCVDIDSTNNRIVFNRTVLLRDTWAKVQRSMRAKR